MTRSQNYLSRQVYQLFGVTKPIPPLYNGLKDPKVGLQALRAAFR